MFPAQDNGFDPGAKTHMNIIEATRSYENWMRRCTHVIEDDLRYKHQQMREDPFFFFRSTFYRWTQLWPELCRDLRQAPKVLAVGDLHVGSYGTWRDAEGRMCWGVDDFDESYPLPYTNDLVRLAASVKIVVDAKSLTVKFKQGCDAILEGYREALRTGGRPFVLAEQQQTLEKLGIDAIEPPEDFWQKLNGRPGVAHGFPSTAKRAIEKTLPAKKLPYKVVRREAGHGSLGQQRFVAIAQWCGAWIAREAKATIPSSCVWLNGTVDHCQTYYETAIKSAVRSHDPYQKMVGGNETGKNIAVSSEGQSPVSIRSHHGASLRIGHIARIGYNCQGKSAHPTSNLASILKTKKGDVHCAFSRQSSLSFSPYSYSLRLHTPRKSSSTAAIPLRMLQSDFCKRLRSAPSKAAPLPRTPSISTSTVGKSPPQ